MRLSDTANLPAELERQRLYRARRGAARRWWLHNRAPVLMAAALATLALGLWGFSESAETRGGGLGGFTDRVYRAVTPFGLGGAPPPLNWQLQGARVLAPLLGGFAPRRGAP